MSNGLNFVGYIVRPDYLLVRRRSVRKLKARMAQFEHRLVRQAEGCTVFRHDAETLEQLRATWASYRAHCKMANTFRLRQSLLSRFSWVNEFFEVEEGLLVERWRVPAGFRTFKEQYRFFANRCTAGILFFQVGSFIECYDHQAEKAMSLLNLKGLKGGRGFGRRCGFSMRLMASVRRRLLQRGLPVTVVREQGDRPWLGRVKPRYVAERWRPTCESSMKSV